MDKSLGFIKNLLYIVFVFSLTFLFGLVIKLEINMPLQLIIVSFVSLIVKFFILNPIILYGLLIISFIAVLAINHYIMPIISPFLERLYFLFSNIIKNFQGKEKIVPENIFIFWGLILIILSLYTAYILFRDKSIYFLLPVYMGFYLYYWYSYYDQALWMLIIFAACFLILFGLTKYSKQKEKVHESKSINIERLYSPWVTTTVNYSILIVILALLLPKSNDYIRWNWLQNKVYAYFPFVENLRSYGVYRRESGEATLFDFESTGFQTESSKLGGPVALSNKKIMTIRGEDVKYLRGNIKHTYTGHSWETQKMEYKDYDLAEDFSNISSEDKKLYYTSTDIKITNHNFASTTLFSPLVPELINFNESSSVKVNYDYSLIFAKGVYDNEVYFIRALKPLPYGKLTHMGIDNKKSYIPYPAKYLQLPDDKITNRTRSIVYDLTHDKENDFEKAKAIEDYLRNNFKYNLNVETVPENYDFVDYFLFEEKEGYCTYFASSMAVMLRLAHIPSRYIEGYLVQDKIENGVYAVRQDDAHAWVEAFIEPVGWMTFEATPEYPIESRMEDFKPIESSSNSQSDETIDDNNRRRNLEDKRENNIQLDIGIGDIDTKIDTNDNAKKLFNTILIIAIAIILSIIPIKFIVGFIIYRYGEYKARKLNNNARIVYLYNQIVNLIALLGFPQKSGETHYEYAKRVIYKFYDYEKIDIKKITDIFVKSKYSTVISSDEEVAELLEYRTILEKRAKHYLGRRKYYFKKYVNRG